MDSELVHFHALITRCEYPEDLFGDLAPDLLKNLKTQFHRFAKIAHVDRYQRLDEQRLAHITFTKLNDFNQQAVVKIEAGTYGTKAKTPKKSATPPVILSAKGTYVITDGLAVGDVSTVYSGNHNSKVVILKMSLASRYNGFLTAEANTLKKLNKAAAGTTSYQRFIPTVVDSFLVKNPDPRQVNVFETTTGFRSLAEIRNVYPTGVDQRHFVWIFNRLLTVLSFTHGQGLVHGAILPEHILVHPVTHAIHLIDWCFSTERGKPITTISTKYRDWYPPEVLAKTPASAATDIYMAAQCMRYLLGGESYRSFAHPKFQRLLDSCWIKSPARRHQSAWELYKDFQVLAGDVFGPRRYLKLDLP